jgi:DNA-binding NarL/FixJ family response regulator
MSPSRLESSNLPVSITRVVVADQNRTYAEALSRICAELLPLADVQVHCEARQMLAALHAGPADLLLLGLAFTDIDGADLLNLVGCEQLARHTLIISARWEEHVLLSMRTARFDGAIDTASEPITAIKEAIHRIFSGQGYISATLRRYLIDDLPGAEAARTLTMAETRVLRIIGDGSDNQEAAERLGLSVATVQTHRRNIMRKLRVSTSAKLVREAVRLGIVRIAPGPAPWPGR